MRTIPREVQSFSDLKASFKLSSTQRAVLLGTLIGDGSLKRRGNYHRLHIKHSKNQLSFVRYKRDIFSNITNMSIRIFTQEVKGKPYEFCEFVTLTHPEFTKVYEEVYINGSKTMTSKFLKDFNDPLSLALWFMDDGCADFAGASFNTQCFEKEEIDLLIETLKKNFGLETTSRRNKRGWVIYVPKRQMNLFRSLVEKHILPEFSYKLTPYSERH